MIFPPVQQKMKVRYGRNPSIVWLGCKFSLQCHLPKNPEQKQKRDYCAFTNSLKNKQTKYQNKKTINPNTQMLLIQLWAKTNQRKQKNL